MIESAGFGTYIFFGIMCGLAGVWAYIFVPETKGRTLEELADIFDDHSELEDKEAVRQALSNASRSGREVQEP